MFYPGVLCFHFCAVGTESREGAAIRLGARVVDTTLSPAAPSFLDQGHGIVVSYSIMLSYHTPIFTAVFELSYPTYYHTYSHE